VIASIKTKIEWVKAANFWAGLTLLFCSILFFYDLFDGRYLLTERDLGPYFIPPRFFWVESIKNGDFPLWNPYQFSGHPFFANPQHAIVYPLNGLFFLLPFDTAFNAIIILHFFLGGLFTYLFLRDLRLHPTGALISGLIFMLSGYLLSVHSLLSCLLSVIWTPLIMMFFRRAIGNPGSKNEIITALFITISFLGGGVEIVYGNFLLLLFMAMFSSFSDITVVGDKPHRYKFLSSVPIYWGRIEFLLNRFKSLFIISAIFLLLSAIQFIPFLELWVHSIRGKGLSYQEATVWSFAPKDILLFFLPDMYGYFIDMKKYWINQCWFKTLYTGGLPFILSLIFFFFPHRVPLPNGGEGRVRGFGKERRLFLSLMIFSLFLSLGQYNPLYPFVFKYVPFFNGIRYPVKFLYIFILILSITAGMGFEKLVEFSKEGGRRGMKHLFIIFALVSGISLIILILGHQEIEHLLRGKGVDAPDFNFLPVNLYHAKRFLFYLTLFFLLLRIGHEVQWKGWTKVLLIFFLIADLFGNMGFYGKERTSDYFQKTKVQEIIASDKEHFRVFATGKTVAQETPILIGGESPLSVFKEKHIPTMNLLFRLHDVWGIDVVHLKRVDDLYKAFIGAPSISSNNLVHLYGIKYVISVTPIEKGSPFELIYARLEGLRGKKEDLLKENTIKLYRNRKHLRRGWFVKEFLILNEKSILATLTSKEFNPQKKVVLEEEPIWTKVPICPDLKNKIDLISESNNRLQFLVKVREESLLILSDTYFPGWKAYLDGKPVKIFRANYNFRAVSIPPGKHEVKFVYHPLSVKLGVLVTSLGIIGILVMGLSSQFKRRVVPPVC
jgi:hypothetical protein